MQVKLIVVEGHARQREMVLDLPLVVGRSRAAGLTIGDPKVSRQHCFLEEHGGMVMLRDNGSLNGTIVDGERVEGEAVIRPGAKLTIGPLTFVVVYEPTGEGVQADTGLLPPASRGAPDFEALLGGADSDDDSADDDSSSEDEASDADGFFVGDEDQGAAPAPAGRQDDATLQWLPPPATKPGVPPFLPPPAASPVIPPMAAAPVTPPAAAAPDKLPAPAKEKPPAAKPAKKPTGQAKAEPPAKGEPTAKPGRAAKTTPPAKGTTPAKPGPGAAQPAGLDFGFLGGEPKGADDALPEDELPDQAGDAVDGTGEDDATLDASAQQDFSDAPADAETAEPAPDEAADDEPADDESSADEDEAPPAKAAKKKRSWWPFGKKKAKGSAKPTTPPARPKEDDEPEVEDDSETPREIVEPEESAEEAPEPIGPPESFETLPLPEPGDDEESPADEDDDDLNQFLKGIK